jgi:hypothetical protein
MNMVLIYLFASMKLQKGHKKIYLALVLNYEVGWSIYGTVDKIKN